MFKEAKGENKVRLLSVSFLHKNTYVSIRIRIVEQLIHSVFFFILIYAYSRYTEGIFF